MDKALRLPLMSLILALPLACQGNTRSSLPLSLQLDVGSRAGSLVINAGYAPISRTTQANWDDVRKLVVRVKDMGRTQVGELDRKAMGGSGGLLAFGGLRPGTVSLEASVLDGSGADIGSSSTSVDVPAGKTVRADLRVRLRSSEVAAGGIEAGVTIEEGQQLLVIPEPGETAATTFRHAFVKVEDKEATLHRVSLDGVRVYRESWGRQGDPLTYWGPLAANLPGSVVYRYVFSPRALVSGSLAIRTSAWDYTTGTVCCGVGRGSVRVDVSSDGDSWREFMRNAPSGAVQDQVQVESLPSAFVGVDEVWVRATMESSVAQGYSDAQIIRAMVDDVHPSYVFEANLR